MWSCVLIFQCELWDKFYQIWNVAVVPAYQMWEKSVRRGLTLITYYQSESTELSSLSTPVSVRDLLSTKNSESAVWYTFWQINEQSLQRNHVKKFTISPIMYKLLSCLGDLDGSDPDHVVCVDNVNDFTEAFLFSLETQHTIGWVIINRPLTQILFWTSLEKI